MQRDARRNSMWICRKNYSLKFNACGGIEFLGRSREDFNIVKKSNRFFGVPFVNGTFAREKVIKLNEVMPKVKSDKSFIGGLSEVDYRFSDECIQMNVKFHDDGELRRGINLDMRFLDSDSGGIEDKIMMTECYCHKNMEYGYFLFRDFEGGYFVLILHDNFTAYRMKYSYFGHRIKGFQILTKVEGVKTDEHVKLRECNQIKLSMFFAEDQKHAKKKISEVLGMCIPKFALSGSCVGNDFRFKCFGKPKLIKLINPEGEIEEIGNTEKAYHFKMNMKGLYKIVFKDRVESEFSVLAHDKLEEYFDRVCRFNRENFQHGSGAFYRAINKSTLSPDNTRTFEGVHFGNPKEKMSCRTGEFGGFAGWSMLKYLKNYGEEEYLTPVKKYIELWGLNSENKKPLFGTVCRKKQFYGGKNYTPYHLYKERNFPQYEIFFIEQVIDYYHVVKDEYVLTELFAMGDHFMDDHIEGGVVKYHNSDYSSVHTPAIAFIKLQKLAQEVGEDERAVQYGKAAEEICRHIYLRGFDFQTEGEKCTEDGSISCSALQLLYYCWHVDYNTEFFEMAKKLLDFHKILEFTLPDARMYCSSIRFWETLYETRDYGPSYNCGHAWTIWTSEAKFYMGLLTGDVKWIEESYCGFISNMSKVQENGGMTACYTPDIIPGIPHHYFVFRYDFVGLLKRDKELKYGRGYSRKSYSSSGNYFLIKYEETFNWLSAIDMKNKVYTNLRVNRGVFESLGREFNTLIIGNLIEGKIEIRVSRDITIYYKEDRLITSDYNQIIRDQRGRIIIKMRDGRVSIKVGYINKSYDSDK